MQARAGTPASVGIATGQYGMRKEIPHALGIDLQVRMPWRWMPWRWTVFRPASGVLASSNGSVMAYSGILIDFPLAASIHLTPGFAPAFVVSRGDEDLGSRLEFRSSLEVSFAPMDEVRIALAFSHVSNARLTHRNPGVEVLTLGFSFPTGP